MKYLAAAFLLTSAIPSYATVPVEQALELCRAEQNALRRLTCYDAIEMKTSSLTTPSAQAESKHPDNNPTVANKADDFGMEHRKVDPQEQDRIYVKVKSVGYNDRKERIFEFDNGQIWRQTESGHYAINVGETHFIKRGILNAFFIGNDNNNRTVRVRREQ